MRSVIEEAPLQIYCSGLVFTPQRSILREIFQRDIPAWFETPPQVEDNWSPIEQTLQHRSWVERVAVSPSGSLLAAVCLHHGTFLWNTATGQQIMDIDHDDEVIAVAFLDDGSKLAETCYNDAVRLWSTTTGQLLWTIDGTRGMVSAASLDYSPVLDRSMGGSLHFRTKENTLKSVAFSFGSPALVCTLDESKVHVKNLDTGETEQILKLGGDVRCVAISRSGFQIAASTYERIVCFRAMEAAATQRAVQYQQSSSCRAISALALEFSSDGLKLAAGRGDGCVVLWDLTADSMVDKELSPRHADFITQLAFSADDTKLLSSSRDATIRVWDVTSGETEQILQGHSDAVRGVAFFPDGRRVVSGSTDGTARVWNIALEQEHGMSAQIAVRHVSSMAISLDTNMVAAVFNNRSLELWNVKVGKMQQQLIEREDDTLTTMAFSSDGTMVAAGCLDGDITLWSTADGKRQRVLRAGRDKVDALALSHDGMKVASASVELTNPRFFFDYLIKVWDISQAKLEQTLYHPCQVQSMAFSPDGEKLAAATDHGTIKIWNLRTSEDQVTVHSQSVPRSLRFSPDSTVLAAGHTAGIELFQVASGQLLHEISGRYRSVDSIVFLNERIELAMAYDIADDGWIRRNGERILYLPIDYRSNQTCVQGDVVTLGTSNHGIVALEFSPDIETAIGG
jgi:WD40 repeat protein